jgi:hypothetical protein
LKRKMATDTAKMADTLMAKSASDSSPMWKKRVAPKRSACHGEISATAANAQHTPVCTMHPRG